ncbi:MAG: GlsB/YeaQ/YmgE family stress response membrane protein [Erysipelotrichaceae bacterium]|jgi:uncharacterized membrane protein YeaQ/YmgE (transglycosylase-associated protein family)|nr:GlsB/YeaQ/YmgE family stress response membrane protein [Erysipelotrichaceae bacterium]
MKMINLLISLVIGAGCGWLVTQLMKLDSSNMIFNCFLGIIGGMVGGLGAGLLGFSARGPIATVILSVVGGCLFVWAYRKFTGKDL